MSDPEMEGDTSQILTTLVLGFWGGVGGLGTMFLVVVLSQRYCCKKDDDKDDGDG